MKIGQKIRQRRQELGLNLSEVADKAGLTASFLSQIERDLTSLSLNSLHKISEALDIPLLQLLPTEQSKKAVVRRDHRLKIILPDSDVVYELLTPDLNYPMNILMIQLEPGAEPATTALNGPVEACLYVLQGRLELELDNRTCQLGPGDSIYFEGPRLRRLSARGDETLRIIAAVTPSIF